jgi:hypothetical protein
MFESITGWVERILRPVFRVSNDGTSYLARTPTLYDLSLIDNPQTCVLTMPCVVAGAGSTATLQVPQGKKWIVLDVSCKCLTNVVHSYTTYSYNIDGNEVYGYALTPAVNYYLAPSSLNTYGARFAIILKYPDQLSVRTIPNAANTPLYATILFVEVNK